MLIANLVVLLIVLGCAAYQYLKGTLLKSFATVIIAVCASTVAFAYFELLANVFISRSDNNRFPAIVPWAQPLSLALLFVLTFAILQTAAANLLRQPVDLGQLPERIGRPICGIFLGLILSGLLLTALAMAPLPIKYPYTRFDENRPDPEKPAKALFNTEGFVTGWFSLLSKGSFSGKASFAALHPDFITQLFLNRHKAADGVSIVTSSNAIEVPKRQGQAKAAAAWIPSESLKDSHERPIPGKTGNTLTMVRVGIKKNAVDSAGKFTLSQLRLICKQKASPDAQNPLTGKGRNIYPLGYLKARNQLQLKRLDDPIEVKRSDFDGAATVRWLDFAFYVPNDSVPVLVEFKQNSIAEVPPLVSAEEAPAPVPFVDQSDRQKETRAKSKG